MTASFDYSAVLWSANDIKENPTYGHEAANSKITRWTLARNGWYTVYNALANH